MPHPFDGPYAIMKGLNTELANLKAELKAEQQQRATEVKRLQDEVRGLQEALAKERSDRLAACDGLNKKLAAETARSEGALKAFDIQTSAALRQRALVEDFEALQKRVLELAKGLDDECKERQVKCDVLDSMITANTAADNKFAHQTVQDLQTQKELLEQNTANDKWFADVVLPRLLKAGQLLQAGCGPSLPSNGSTMGNTPPMSGTLAQLESARSDRLPEPTSCH